jgi:prepilin-type N-terminal cleavage/methylation domain-containing protein
MEGTWQRNGACQSRAMFATPLPSTKTKAKSMERGPGSAGPAFTLIELLVVIAIISVPSMQ